MNDLVYQWRNVEGPLADFVERFWMLENQGSEDREIVVIPDGRIDLLCAIAPDEPFRIVLLGLETVPSQHNFSAGTVLFGVSLKLLAVEYLLQISLSDYVNEGQWLPDGFWGIVAEDLNDFGGFCEKVELQVALALPEEVDNRKRKLFKLMDVSKGELSVKELSEKVCWSSRQINRYFNQQFGLSLKAYCKILRFRASFPHIKDGKLAPALNFADQSHFIKEVKKLSGATPKELFRNKNDRFIQFSTLPPE